MERANQLLTEKQKYNNVYLITGHTSTDNAETFLLNLARGSNYAGLSYINKKRLLKHHIFLIRPLLIFSREDTKKFCQLQNIPIWEDPTNCDLTIKRNVVRKEIIPILEQMAQVKFYLKAFNDKYIRNLFFSSCKLHPECMNGREMTNCSSESVSHFFYVKM